MQGTSLRDQVQKLNDAGCEVFGISFDNPADNYAFQQEHDLGFSLLSDTDQSVGEQYLVLRDADDQFADYPKRIAYLIDPDGRIAAADEVTDPAGYGEQALATLAAAQR